MDQKYLQDLINEVNVRDGGLILSLNGTPTAVVLSLEKYNTLVSKGINQFSSQNLEFEYEKAFRPQTILVTGGAGYIGAHITRQLINAGHNVFVLDNLSSGFRENVPLEAKFVEGDIRDINFLRDIFANNKFDFVFHLAASIEVEESVKEPMKYLENNAINTYKLLKVMDEAKVKNIIFSSTAAVYAEKNGAICEDDELKPKNPYGESKLIAENFVKYFCVNNGFNAVVFRYFNACGSDYSIKIKPTHESHLLSKLMLSILKNSNDFVINGNDYKTFDGTCERDFVHILDIANAHILAMEKKLQGFNVFNIGTGRSVSVLQMFNEVKRILNLEIPVVFGPRRIGDPESLFSDIAKIQTTLEFKPMYSDLETIIKTTYRQLQK